jgi:hypothetical protein
MDTDRNLLFAVLALQADVLDRDCFVLRGRQPSVLGPASERRGLFCQIAANS